MRVKKLVRSVHKWAGIAAFWWLLILGLTGVILNHPEWRWPHQTVISGLSTPVNKKNGQHLVHPRQWTAHIAVNADDGDHWLSGGRGGLWVTVDAGNDWKPVDFDGTKETPQAYALVPAQPSGLNDVWLATDDGLWKTTAEGRQAERVAFKGMRVTSLVHGAKRQTLLAVIDKSRLVRFTPSDPHNLHWLQPGPAPISNLPTTVSLNRWGFDLHLGTGFFSVPFSILVSDLAGIAMAVLAISGFLYWLLPRRWRKTKTKTKPSAQSRRALMRWLFRGHVVFTGLIMIVPIFYLSVTGLFLGHKSWFQSWSENVSLPRATVSGNYDLQPFSGEILAIGARADSITMVTRMGMLESSDDGVSWTFDEALPFNLATSWNRLAYFQLGNLEVVSDAIGRNYIRPSGDRQWQLVEDIPGFLILGTTKAREVLYLHTMTGLHAGTFESGFEAVSTTVPPLSGLDLAFVVRVIHGVLVFNDILVWFNDAMALLATLLILTGFYYWLLRKKKWM